MKGIYQVYTRYIFSFERYIPGIMAFHMTGIYKVNDRYLTNVIYLVYTCHMKYVVI